MPKCKYCNSRLSKFDKDICPICGAKHPLEGVSGETVEITSDLALNIEELKSFKPATKFKAMMAFIFLGWTGFPMFYLRYILQGFIWLALNLMVFALIFLSFFFLMELGIIPSLLIPIGIIYGINIIAGIIVFFKHNLKDNRGEFLR